MIVDDNSFRVPLLIYFKATFSLFELSLIEASNTTPNEPYPSTFFSSYFNNLIILSYEIFVSIFLLINFL